MAPKNIRSQLGSIFQFFFTMGVMTSYWVDYAVGKHLEPSTRQWQIPVGLQLVPGGILGLGMLLCKESTRWLAKRGRNEEALQSLIWVRGGEDTPEVRQEFDEILAGIEEEVRATEGLTWKELLLPENRYRLFIAIILQIGVQLTGNTSLAYYSPQIFAAVGAGNSSLLISGFFGVYMSEIFPSRIREIGIAIGTATQWLFNFVFSQITPHALDNIGWRTFLMFCIFNWSLVVYTWFFIKETKGKSLEEMEHVFRSKETALGLKAVHAEEVGRKPETSHVENA
ncbi:hypothetical protein M432DRAFT_672160 [Thermoascus aurantiacus ATCC 26904]